MEFLNKTFTSKEDLSNFIKDYCYNFGYLTFIRSSSNKKGLVRIMCNSTGTTKGSPPATKKQKFGDCPFVATGKRTSDDSNIPEIWQITIFNNSHNHLPVIDFSTPSTLNVSGSNIHPSESISTSTAYNSVLDLFETNLTPQHINNHNHIHHSYNNGNNNNGSNNNNLEDSQNLTLHTDLFTTRIIQNISNKLLELREEEKKVFLNRFNKLLYEDMPKFRVRGETIENDQKHIIEEHLYNPAPTSTIIPTIVNTSRVIASHNCANCGEAGHDTRNCSSIHNQKQLQHQQQQQNKRQHQQQKQQHHQEHEDDEGSSPRLEDQVLSYIF